MLEQMTKAMNQQAAMGGIDAAQQIFQCTLRLTQSQMKVMSGLYKELGQECRDALTPSDPAELARQWPGLISASMVANSEAGVQLMNNARAFQDEVLEVIESSIPEVPEQLTESAPVTANRGTAASRQRKKNTA